MSVLGVAWLAAAVAWLLWMLQATVRGWWIQDRRDQAYTAHKFDQLKGGEPDDARLGLVNRRRSLAGGKGSVTGSPCKYCGQVDGHTAQCPVVSFGVVR